MSKGLSFEIAGWSLALIGLFNIVGALIAGWLGDKILKKNSLAYIYLARSIVITFFILIQETFLDDVVSNELCVK